jgi:AraC-like DNA-binding protein
MTGHPETENCRNLCGTVEEQGWSVCDHRYPSSSRTDWSDCFHRDTAGFYFNYAGSGEVVSGRSRVEFGSRSTGLFNLAQTPVRAVREQAEEHSFITLHFSRDWLSREVRKLPRSTWSALDHPLLETGKRPALFVRPLSAEEAAFGEALRRPPVTEAGRLFWYQSKVMELLALQLFSAPPPGEMFCTRQKLLAHERVERARQLIRDNLAQPLSLDELGRQAGCSPFYLCRIFSAETGITLTQFLRRERMQRAASLLESGSCNVTQAALEVGYNSLSHFSKAFLEEMGCCPGLYPAGRHLFRASNKS